MIDLTTLTGDDLDALRIDVLTEQERRARLETTPSTIEQLNRDYLDAEGTQPGQPWRQPTGAHNAYPEGWTVEHNNKTWISLTPANTWEPGVSGWREVTEPDPDTGDPTYPEYVQPTGGHDAYNKGDRVTFDGAVYESLIDGNVWSPTAHAAGWQRID